jgi:hypothetical protein
VLACEGLDEDLHTTTKFIIFSIWMIYWKFEHIFQENWGNEKTFKSEFQ